MNILKIIINKYNGIYPIKIDSYFLCTKTNEIKLNIKFKNKRSIVCILLQDLLKKNLYNFTQNLHPTDICIISILSNRSDLLSITSLPSSIRDDNIMFKINNHIRIVNQDFSSNEKNILLKVQGSDSTIRLSAADFFQNMDLLNALDFQDAFIIGANIEQEYITTIINHRRKFNILTGIVISLYCAFFIIYLLSTNEDIYILSNNKISISIICIPLIMSLLAYIINTLSYDSCKFLLKWHLISTLIFMSYIFFITSLPYNTSSHSIISMNNLFNKVELHYPITICVFYLSVFVCLEINNKHIIFKHNQTTIVLILLYLMINTIMSYIFTDISLSKFDIIYLVVSIFFFVFLDAYYITIHYNKSTLN
jgi:hypothetical protein